MTKAPIFILIPLAIAILLLFPAPAYAYLDPGTGSFILQMVLAVILSSLFALKSFWKKLYMKIRELFKRKKGGTDE